MTESNEHDPIITISHVWKYFGHLPALQDVSLEVSSGERVVIIGPSGSGKSTLLRSINRLEEIDKGEIMVEGQDIMSRENNINLIRRNLGMVFQQFNLFPHKTVLQNLTLAPIKLHKLSREEAEDRALGLLKKVGISDKANVYPEFLSGGEQRALRKLMASNEKKIETLKGKIEKKQLEMAAADQSDYLVLTAMQEEIADFETQIEALELEWFEAAEKLGE